VGLLLLRGAAGVAGVVQGVVYLVGQADHNNLTLEIWFAGILAVTSGVLLLIGFLTPAASALMALAVMGIALSWFPPPAPRLFDAPLPAVLVVVIAVAVALLGPGALSLDCRLFGRREIIIPQAVRPPKA
jgi:uncharacterized membrane protein YphA (DoxX/SURF4 family)